MLPRSIRTAQSLSSGAAVFFTQCAHTPDPASARAFIEQIRRRHADATHNCWAYASGAPGDTAQIGSSDDGEPHGTAGRTHVADCAAQRHWRTVRGREPLVWRRKTGHWRLGAGLSGQRARNLASLAVRQRVPESSLSLTVGYAHLDALRRMLPTFEARLESEDYQADARLRLRLPAEHIEAFTAALAGVSNGAAQCRVLTDGEAD